MKSSHTFFAALAAAITLGVLQTGSVSAQTAEPAAPLADSLSAAPEVTDTKLEQFADAYVAIQTIQKDAAATPSASSDPGVTQQLQSKMADAVQKSGLQVTEFNQIAQAMTTDADLRAKVIEKVQQRAKLGG